ncbi:sensor histidine kinase [Undibacterium flavidum]|uniref:histidine kinase n=1 Tax=Undibacterium flavidum TaxID=2762297 RepID=A0ABR6YHK0_9BURK|nr:ATP-binding protein [Undibacterium flavidum]MBC3876060.1 sensor histidine kinase [Undibacterium flavidum]
MSATDSFSEIAALSIHDVKNNLAQLAAEAEARGDVKSQQLALQASETLTGLLCFYRSETHSLAVQIEAQDPQELIADLLSHHQGRLNNRADLHIQTHLEQAPGVAFYDKTLIQMVLANALQNALRYARSQIDISVVQADYLEICVQDDGDGYPAALLENHDQASAVSSEGTGLGLRLARSVVALHTNEGRCGEIRLSNLSQNGGAKFQLLLP